jgi:checkpoint serine/threonine-protein kinase
MNKNWRTQKEPLKQISGNATGAGSQTINSNTADTEEDLPEQLNQKLSIDGQQSRQIEQDARREAKAAKSKKFKVHGDTQTGKC